MTRADTRTGGRPSFDPGIQRQAMMWLVLGGLLFALLALAAALFVASPGGAIRTLRIRQTLDGFMVSGREQQALAGHRLFSSRGLIETSLSDVQAMYGRRASFEGYRAMRIASLTEAEGVDGAVATERMAVEAVALYDEGPNRAVSAIVEREAGEWRILSISVGDGEPIR